MGGGVQSCYGGGFKKLYAHICWLKHEHPDAFLMPDLHTHQIMHPKCHLVKHRIETLVNIRRCLGEKSKKNLFFE